jgi:hypothetical protein
VPAFVRLLRDNEAEVRIAAAGKVTKFCRILSPQLAIQHILPCVKVGANKLPDNIMLLVFFSLQWTNPCQMHHRNCHQILPSMFVQLWLQSLWEWLLYWGRFYQ